MRHEAVTEKGPRLVAVPSFRDLRVKPSAVVAVTPPPSEEDDDDDDDDVEVGQHQYIHASGVRQRVYGSKETKSESVVSKGKVKDKDQAKAKEKAKDQAKAKDKDQAKDKGKAKAVLPSRKAHCHIAVSGFQGEERVVLWDVLQGIIAAHTSSSSSASCDKLLDDADESVTSLVQLTHVVSPKHNARLVVSMVLVHGVFRV